MVQPYRTPNLTLGNVSPFQGTGVAGDTTPWWLKQQQQQQQAANQLTGQGYAAPAHAPGSTPASPPVWATNGGTATGYLGAGQSSGPNDIWFNQSQADYPQAGMEYQQKASSPPTTYNSKAAPETTPTVPPGTKPLFNPETVQKGNEAIYGPTAAAQSDGKVKVNADGSWTLPNGSTIPGNARTVVDIDGVQIPLPFYNGVGMPGRGDFRFTVNGHQTDAVSFLVQRLKDAKGRGLNIQDPNVIYDEIARIRDDMKAAGVQDADLDRASGIGGLQNFVRTAGSAAAAGNGAPPGSAAPTGGGQGGNGAGGQGGTLTPNPDGSPSLAAIAKAAQDQNFGFNILMKSLTGSDKFGGGPFDDFMQQFLGPILTSTINAMGEGGTIPTNIGGLLGNLKSMLAGGTTDNKNLYQYLGDLGREAMRKTAGRGDIALSELTNNAQMYSPLTTMGMNQMGRSAFYRQRDDALRALQNQVISDPTLGAGRTDWNTYFNQSPFYQQYYR